jgi:hypothetical protein
MSIAYTWSFPQFEVAPSDDGLTDVVKVINWRLDAADGVFSAGAYGTVALGAPDPLAFTPYANISEQWAIDAVSANIDLPAVEAALAGEINKKKTPSTVSMSPPFVQS